MIQNGNYDKIPDSYIRENNGVKMNLIQKTRMVFLNDKLLLFVFVIWIATLSFRISVYDPVAIRIGLRPGDICKIYRDTNTSIISKYYIDIT